MTWHGCSDQQWRDCWAAANWQHAAVASLEQIAMCREASIGDRMSALMMLNQGLEHGLLSPLNLTRPFVVFSRDVLLSIAAGARPPRWWKRWRWKRIRAQCSDRIEALRFMLNMSVSFMHASSIEVVNAPVGFLGVGKGLPS